MLWQGKTQVNGKYLSRREGEKMQYKFVGYAELGDTDGPKMKDCFEAKRYEEQDRIVRYLKGTKSAKELFVSTAIPKDVFTNESIKMEDICMGDDIYAWSNILSYYVDKYNLRLPKEFEEHILKSK